MDYLKYVQEQFHYDGDAEISERMRIVVMKFAVPASDLPGIDRIREVVNGFPDRDQVEIFLFGESENSFSIRSGSMKTDEEYADFSDYPGSFPGRRDDFKRGIGEEGCKASSEKKCNNPCAWRGR